MLAPDRAQRSKSSPFTGPRANGDQQAAVAPLDIKSMKYRMKESVLAYGQEDLIFNATVKLNIV
jgi:hypothetical protein